MGKQIKMRSLDCRMFFVRPGRNRNVYSTASRLAGMERVREVIIAEGDVGFIVKTDALAENDTESLLRQISKVTGGSSAKAVCYCQLNK